MMLEYEHLENDSRQALTPWDNQGGEGGKSKRNSSVIFIFHIALITQCVQALKFQNSLSFQSPQYGDTPEGFTACISWHISS